MTLYGKKELTLLLNASNLKNGGGLQVADSICRQLPRFKNHYFIVVVSSALNNTIKAMADVPNVRCFSYDLKDDWQSLILGRNKFLDGLVESYNVDAVLTVFGPSRWKPKVPHLCGFARAQLLKDVNPNVNHSLKERIIYKIWEWGFRRSSDTFYTENPYISDMLPNLLGKGVRVYTVTNYYNQVFDHPEQWKRTKTLPEFNGTTCLSVSSHYTHKNFEILIDIVRCLKRSHPDFKVRFVLTFTDKEMPVPDKLKDAILFIGKVGVEECPYLYEQADIMFMPTLMECFTATYPEAMRMEVPIVTTNLDFARGLCGDAACYYSAVDADEAAKAVYRVATDKELALELVTKGKIRLTAYDNYEARAKKLVKILEEIAG